MFVFMHFNCEFNTFLGLIYNNTVYNRTVLMVRNQGCTIPGGASGVPHMKILGRRSKINVKMKNFEDT